MTNYIAEIKSYFMGQLNTKHFMEECVIEQF